MLPQSGAPAAAAAPLSPCAAQRQAPPPPCMGRTQGNDLPPRRWLVRIVAVVGGALPRLLLQRADPQPRVQLCSAKVVQLVVALGVCLWVRGVGWRMGRSGGREWGARRGLPSPANPPTHTTMHRTRPPSTHQQVQHRAAQPVKAPQHGAQRAVGRRGRAHLLLWRRRLDRVVIIDDVAQVDCKRGALGGKRADRAVQAIQRVAVVPGCAGVCVWRGGWGWRGLGGGYGRGVKGWRGGRGAQHACARSRLRCVRRRHWGCSTAPPLRAPPSARLGTP